MKLHVDGTNTDGAGDVSKLSLSAFVKHLVIIHSRLATSEFFFFLQVVNIGDFDIQKAVKRLRQIKSV